MQDIQTTVLLDSIYNLQILAYISYTLLHTDLLTVIWQYMYSIGPSLRLLGVYILGMMQ